MGLRIALSNFFVNGILLFISFFEIIQFSYVDRKFNEVAHLLAKFIFDQDENFEWFSSFPSWLDGMTSACCNLFMSFFQ